MHYPGDLVRRAAANVSNKVSNTVSSVASTVTQRFKLNINADDGVMLINIK